MKKLKKFIKNRYKDFIIISIFIITYLIMYMYLTKNGTYFFASSKDFDVQHYLLPEYLRVIFLNTHSLFPRFSFNLAAIFEVLSPDIHKSKIILKISTTSSSITYFLSLTI